MKASDLVRTLCKQKRMTISEMASKMGQTPQNFGKKLKRDTLTVDEMVQIADADIMEVTYFQGFLTHEGDRIEIKTVKERRTNAFKAN